VSIRPVYCPGGLYDRGLWQLNSKYHPDVSDACAFRAQCNADAAYEVSTRGASFAPWAVYGSAGYARYLAAAEAAVSGLSAGSIPSALFGICLARGQSTVGSAVVIRRCARRHRTEQWTIDAHTIYQGSRCLAAGAVGQPAVTVETCTVSDSQVWTTIRDNQIRNLQNGECLIDPGASRQPGTRLDLAPCAGTREQAWWLP
jgi:Lysozyme like domain/Ricin-type beta-trefoil lectin domain